MYLHFIPCNFSNISQLLSCKFFQFHKLLYVILDNRYVFDIAKLCYLSRLAYGNKLRMLIAVRYLIMHSLLHMYRSTWTFTCDRSHLARAGMCYCLQRKPGNRRRRFINSVCNYVGLLELRVFRDVSMRYASFRPCAHRTFNVFSILIKAQRQETRSTTAVFFTASASIFPIAELGIARANFFLVSSPFERSYSYSPVLFIADTVCRVCRLHNFSVCQEEDVSPMGETSESHACGKDRCERKRH